MNLTYLWLICAISLACADLLLGTAYLLILGIAAALAFLVSLFTDSFTAQAWGFVLFSVIGVLFYSLGRKSSLKQTINSEKLQNINEGQLVEVHYWDKYGRTKVFYRGSHWEAVPLKGNLPTPGVWEIIGMTGNTLIIKFINNK
ncbi:NfeD family protein [Turicimonas muris]|uniref:NfeD family protein n=2 Tax=Turicimonas muris TaxID=1796652 RepID=UPI0025A585A2|nr:NfeD family protein [Turicimonas muris]